MSDSKSIVPLNSASRPFGGTPEELVEHSLRLQRRAERELAARHEAERLLETKSLELFEANRRLLELNAQLEERVAARTKQVEEARREAVRIGATDYLTGISNRLRYSEHLERSFALAYSRHQAVGILLVDLDGFKQVNDTYGHRHGDQLLTTVASRLRNLARADDLVARIGGDEFAVVIVAPDAQAVVSAAHRFHGAFEHSVTIQGITIEARASFGLAISPQHCDNAMDLQRYADLALYKSKSSAVGEIVVFEKVLMQAYEHRQRMEAEFRTALDLEQIQLAYQPIVRTADGEVHAVESLARWTDSHGINISPDYFIPLAEQCGLIHGVGRSLLEKALAETKGWIADGLIERVSFNVSPAELLDPGFSSAIVGALEKAGAEPSHLMLEITEGAIIHNVDLAARIMNRLAALGVAFALDDFGCGYSDLSTLSKLPIRVLKLDRSLLIDAVARSPASIILRNVVNLCRELGIRSVCEGAETEAQSAFLREIQCDYMQGFASGRPATAAALDAVLRDRIGRPNG